MRVGKEPRIITGNLFALAFLVALIILFQLSAVATRAIGGAYREAVQLALAYVGLAGFVLLIAVAWRRLAGLPRVSG